MVVLSDALPYSWYGWEHGKRLDCVRFIGRRLSGLGLLFTLLEGKCGIGEILGKAGLSEDTMGKALH